MPTPASDLVERARHFATQAHRRIDQRRKYTSQPVEVHLKAVAGIVAEVTDDPETIAAAWLHDTVEDTPATLGDVEREFGRPVRELVAEVTDASRPADGNRTARKAIDLEHLSKASPRGQTVKLADLIDNCGDICRHDPRFGRVFLSEMGALLRVLGEGDPGLLERARKEHRQWSDKLAGTADEWDDPTEELTPDWDRRLRASRTVRRFAQVFSAGDIAEPLRSFDEARPLAEIAAILREESLPVVGIRHRGRVIGYLPPSAAEGSSEGECGAARREFGRNQVVEGHTPISAVIEVLTLYDACFVRVLEDVGGVVTRSEMQSPIVRMWLFGIITFVEMRMDERIRKLWTEEEWTRRLPRGRIDKARELREERKRRGSPAR